MFDVFFFAGGEGSKNRLPPGFWRGFDPLPSFLLLRFFLPCAGCRECWKGCGMWNGNWFLQKSCCRVLDSFGKDWCLPLTLLFFQGFFVSFSGFRECREGRGKETGRGGGVQNQAATRVLVRIDASPLPYCFFKVFLYHLVVFGSVGKDVEKKLEGGEGSKIKLPPGYDLVVFGSVGKDVEKKLEGGGRGPKSSCHQGFGQDLMPPPCLNFIFHFFSVWFSGFRECPEGRGKKLGGGGVKIGGRQGFIEDLKPLLQNIKCLSQLQSGNTKPPEFIAMELFGLFFGLPWTKD